MLAVIKTGGKQYIVSPKQKIKIEKIESKLGDEVVFDNVLLIDNDKDTIIGTPLVKGAKVSAKVFSVGKHAKAIIYKYKPKKRYRLKKGHRQPYTEIEITKIEN